MTLVDSLLIGSAKIDYMSKEIKQLTTMLSGLAEHPRAWIRHYEFVNDWGRFHTTFGSLEEDGCVWELWWYEGEFRTRCLVAEVVDGQKVVMCAYGNADYEPHKPRKTFEVQQPRYPHLRQAGVIRARRHLEIFAKGMFNEFPLGVKAKHFLEAAQLPLT